MKRSWNRLWNRLVRRKFKVGSLRTWFFETGHSVNDRDLLDAVSIVDLLHSVPLRTECKRKLEYVEESLKQKDPAGTSGPGEQVPPLYPCPWVEFVRDPALTVEGEYKASYNPYEQKRTYRLVRVHPQLIVKDYKNRPASVKYTIFHEIWHMMDLEMFEAPGWARPPQLGKVKKVLGETLQRIPERTELWKQLDLVKRIAAAEGAKNEAVLKLLEDLSYLANDSEWLARGYADWVASSSGDKALVNEAVQV